MAAQMTMFPIVTIPDDVHRFLEQLGTKPKFWFRNQHQIEWLFKKARSDTGEDWSEKVASELCALLGLPHAHYDLAVWKQKLRLEASSSTCRRIGKGLLASRHQLMCLWAI